MLLPATRTGPMMRSSPCFTGISVTPWPFVVLLELEELMGVDLQGLGLVEYLYFDDFQPNLLQLSVKTLLKTALN